MSDIKDVPPAGDVEVVVYACGPANRRSYIEPGNAFLGWHAHDATPLVDRAHVTRLTAERDRHAHNSKEWESASLHWMAEYDKVKAELTAEVERLKITNTDQAKRIEWLGDYNTNRHVELSLENVQVVGRLIKAEKDCDALQSELTKARELLGEAHDALADNKYANNLGGLIRSYLAKKPIAHNVDESCGQDAEAAKCARCEASTVESCDEKGCGFLGAGNGAPVARTVNGLTDDEWQDRDDQDRQELERE